MPSRPIALAVWVLFELVCHPQEAKADFFPLADALLPQLKEIANVTVPDTDDLQLSIPSSYDAMEEVAALIERAGNRVGISEDDEVDLMISVMEAVNNAIQHGNREDVNKQVHIKIETEPGQLICWVRDEGPGFSPERVPNPLSPEFMDNVEFRVDDTGTSVRMSKHFSVDG